MMKYPFLLLLILLLNSQWGLAQQINTVFAFDSEKKNSVQFNFEFDPALTWGITLNRKMEFSTGAQQRALIGQIGWKTYQLNYHDLNVNVFTQLIPHSSFDIITNVGIEYKYQQNTVHQANVYNVAFGFMPGFYSDVWYLGMEVMTKWLLAARFNHTSYYKELYPDVQDGWYRYKNGFVNLSLNVGVRASEQIDIDFRAGYRMTHDFENYQPYLIPYFADTSLNIRF